MSNPINLFLSDGTKISASLCGLCHRIWECEESAERCCKCSYCGKECDWRIDSVSHNECLDTAFRKREAEQMDKAIIVDDYDGPFLYDDYYFADVDELIEYLENDDLPIPEFVHTAKYIEPKLDIEDIFQNLQENEMHEDWEPTECGPLGEAINAWNVANAANGAWREDNTRKVRISELRVE